MYSKTDFCVALLFGALKTTWPESKPQNVNAKLSDSIRHGTVVGYARNALRSQKSEYGISSGYQGNKVVVNLGSVGRY